MKEFNEIQKNWQKQISPDAPLDGANRVIKKTNTLKRGQQITNLILTITLIILIAFFFYVKAYLETMAILGLGLMIGALLLRILYERLSLKELKKIKYDMPLELFKQKMKKYYQSRIKTHYYLTPLVLLMYMAGFLILMPLFKLQLSEWFYLYIQVSSVLILVIGVYYIYREINKELLILKSLL